MNYWKYSLALLFLPLFSGEAIAHGSKIKYQETRTIQIQATYDNNKPMANAQVVVFAPDDATTPWIKGATDQQGYFSFTPDPTQQGNWDVKVRQAGHGSIITIPLGDENRLAVTLPEQESPKQMASSSNWLGGNPVYTPLQNILLGISGVWGFVGTALYFSRKKSTKKRA